LKNQSETKIEFGHSSALSSRLGSVSRIQRRNAFLSSATSSSRRRRGFAAKHDRTWIDSLRVTKSLMSCSVQDVLQLSTKKTTFLWRMRAAARAPPWAAQLYYTRPNFNTTFYYVSRNTVSYQFI